MYYISAVQTSLLASVCRDENCILIISHLTALASSALVMQISGGSTPLAKEGARVVVAVVVVVVVVVFAYPADFSSFCDFLTQRAPPLDPPLQMDKFKEITGIDVYSVRTFNFLYHVDQRSSIYHSC